MPDAVFKDQSCDIKGGLYQKKETTMVYELNSTRQEFSTQNTETLPLSIENDVFRITTTKS